jgi:hypothetical protein
MDALLDALAKLGDPIRESLVALAGLVLPWTPLLAWIAFWLFAVNWTRLHAIFSEGGWIGIVLIGAVMVLVWGGLAPLASGYHDFFGIHVTNTFVEKFIYVAGLFCIMFLCGALQLSGFAANCCPHEEPILIAESHDAHGHGGHHGDGGHEHAGHH